MGNMIVAGLLITLLLVIGAAFYTVLNTVARFNEYLTEQAERQHAERMALIDERDALLERIQRPEFRPSPRRDETPPPAPDPLEQDLAMVGTVISEAPDGE